MEIKMSLDDAYYLVFKDLTSEEGVLTGRYDAKNGNEHFMYGVLTVMELIAYKCGDACGEGFDNRFIDHMIKSQEKAEQTEPNSSEKPNNSTISKMEQVDKDINVRSKDEPQTNADQHVQHVGSVEPMQTEREDE